MVAVDPGCYYASNIIVLEILVSMAERAIQFGAVALSEEATRLNSK